MNTPNCPKCSQPMDERFIVGQPVPQNQPERVEGPPQTSFWPRLKVGLAGMPARRKVTTFCCPKCGFLESYAETEAE